MEINSILIILFLTTLSMIFFSGTFDTSFSYAFDKIELPHHIDDSIFGLNTNLALLKVKEIKITWIIIEKN